MQILFLAVIVDTAIQFDHQALANAVKIRYKEEAFPFINLIDYGMLTKKLSSF